MQFARIVASVCALTVIWSPEYFTIGHVSIVDIDNRWVLALVWAIAAGLPLGTAFGFGLAGAARNGSRRPLLTLEHLLRGLLVVGLVVGVLSTVAGGLGVILAQEAVPLEGEQVRVPIEDERRPWFVGARWAHLTSYGAGFVGVFVLMADLFGRRKPPEKLISFR